MIRKLAISNTVSEDDLDIDGLLAGPYMYEEGFVKHIVGGIVRQANSLADVIEYADKVLKIEGIEKLSPFLFSTCQQVAEFFQHKGPVTCHLFRSPYGSISFPLHTDPDDVVIYMVKGNKVFKTDSDDVLVNEGEWLHIPKGSMHRGWNIEDSIMLSFGLELFIVEKL